ncbi:MAG TPA: prolyl oligopeptidase family serine peptidase [Tepidisphaeraceae bacterium]|jgi:pimeloyl-ACP methyl ester carboxylesterase
MKPRTFCIACLAALLASGISINTATAQQNRGGIRRIPPAGVAVPDNDRTELQTGVEQLGKEIADLRQSLAKQPAMLDLLPDVQIFHNAVRYALAYDEFFNAGEIAKAKVLLKEGLDRAASLRAGKAPWTKSPGLIVRGYVSRIDGSVQPYGLVVPPTFAEDPSRPRRLDIWYHGRGENLSEINFLADREKSHGEFAPDDTIVLHPYGRFCNANRFAGEVDTFEALDNVKKHYAIDDNRILVRGFSMGGASTWLFATHYPGLWAAANPGAGFSETSDFLHIRDLSTIPWYQQKLWHLYDSTDYAINLFNCPTVAYSGEADPQKQAADKMAKALSNVGITLTHILGPDKTQHRYHPVAKAEVARRIDSIAAHGRNPAPAHIKFTTWTLKYNQMNWLQLDELEHHWERAEIDANLSNPAEIQITTKNINAFTVSFEPGYCPLEIDRDPKLMIDQHAVTANHPQTDRSWTAHFRKVEGKWEAVKSPIEPGLRKHHNLQGPIDDGLMDSFVMVRPTGTALNEKTGAWVKTEMAHAIEHWRRQFRGEAQVKDDTAITDADIASSNLVLWGDSQSNAIWKKIEAKLPVKWDGDKLTLGDKSYPAATDVPVMIYPNPLNSNRYIVLNSGFTFREAAYLNNAMQTPKLPDWAIVDTSTPPSPLAPGKIEAAGFFGEKWEWAPNIQGASAR